MTKIKYNALNTLSHSAHHRSLTSLSEYDETLVQFMVVRSNGKGSFD